MTRTNYLSLEIRYVVECPSFTESYQDADEAEAQFMHACNFTPPARQFVGLYARVPDEDREALPMGLLQAVGDFTDYEAATRMLDLLSGTTRDERAAAGDPDRYTPPDHVTTNGQASPHNELADVLESGAAADIWYDADHYRDDPAAQRIAETKAAMSEAADILRALPGGGSGGGNAARPLETQPKPGDPDQSLMEAACCIWEAMLTAGQWGQTGPLDPPENHALAKAFEDYGTSEMRLTAINLASHCHACWESLPEEDRYNDPFDWEFVPAYVALADWSSGSPQWPYPTPEEIGRAVLAKMQKREAA